MDDLDASPREVPKIPSYHHFPWSPEDSRDDDFMTRRQLRERTRIADEHVVLTEKLDGSNCRLTREAVHSRSRRNPSHPSFNLLKDWHGDHAHLIPEDIVLYGEWCYAVHSIKYETLPRFYPLFVYLALDLEEMRWLSWPETKQIAEEVGVHPVPVIDEYPDGFTEELDPTGESEYGPTREGYVARIEAGFAWETLPKCVAKCVRHGHVQTDEHWSKGEVEPNGFREE